MLLGALHRKIGLILPRKIADAGQKKKNLKHSAPSKEHILAF